ncbi:SRF-type transcription factor (DNA-binding and dimerization domain) domain-containing protein [Sarocladium implicatum]|nr:SRF-type transcription factor (DNA-binding and dimerization domain) domain-containing protein [Sarocladium implicatum]
MGRRKIEIKAIKDDRNRSVTFLKRKGGLFKKAHELSVLCSVDVAVFIFGNNKKLYEYSSSDMGDLITRYQYHGGANEHKGPSDFNGGNDEDEDEEGDGTPPQGHDGMDHGQMPPPQFHTNFPQIRHHTASASPPIGNGAFGHPGQPQGPHPQQPPNMGSRPSSRNDSRRLGGPGMVPQPPHHSIAYMPTPPIYNPQAAANQPGMIPQQVQPYPYPQGGHQQQQSYGDDRRPPPPPAYQQGSAPHLKAEPSPPLHPHHQNIPRISVSPQPERRFSEPQPPPKVEPKTEPQDRPQPPLLKTDAAVKKLPQRKSHSIFTPIEENRSILSQHLASFQASDMMKSESGASIAAAAAANRANEAAKARSGHSSSPPQPQRTSSQSSLDKGRPTGSSEFPPPARSNSLGMRGPGGGARPRGPPLTLQIPADEASEGGGSAAGDSSPQPPNSASHIPQRHNSHSSVVLPPPSPSGASAILSAGATGPPNPFARPPPQQGVNGETPVSALPSRFLNHEFLPSPSSFYPEWNYRGSDSNTLPSPLNFATPVAGSGPSFLRDDSTASNTAATSATAGSSAGTATTQSTTATAGPAKRKSPEYEGSEQNTSQDSEAKRLKV